MFIIPVSVIVSGKEGPLSSSSGVILSSRGVSDLNHAAILLVPMRALWPYHLACNSQPPIHRLQDDIELVAMHGTVSSQVTSNQAMASICCIEAAQASASLVRSQHSEWSFDWPDSPPSSLFPTPKDAHLANFTFLVFKILPPLDFPLNPSFTPALSSHAGSSTHLSPGQAVHIIGSPFAHLSPTHFTNCIFSGCLSAIVSNSLLWIDTSGQYPGMVGSMVVDSDGFEALGLLLHPLTRRKDKAQVVLAVTFREIIRELRNVGISVNLHLGLKEDSNAPHLGARRCLIQASDAALMAAANSVCLVTVGRKWATGIIASAGEGIVLTVAHLFKEGEGEGEGERKSLRVRVGHDRWIDAQMIFIFKTQDLAVLRIESAEIQDMRQVNLLTRDDSPLEQGMECWVVGYGLFGPSPLHLGPRFTDGNLVKSVRGYKGKVSMLITSCSVHSGASGGALMALSRSRKEMKLIGIITSNTKLSTENETVLLPQLSYAIPPQVLSPLFEIISNQGGRQEQLSSNHFSHLKVEDDDDDSSSGDTWSLEGSAANRKRDLGSVYNRSKL